MSVFKKNWPLLAVVVGLFACKNEPKPAPPIGGDSSTPAHLLVPEIHAWTAAVSKLNLRETPAADGKVATMLEKGALLTGTGKHSDTKISMKFQDIEEQGFFWEVTTTEGKTGWVFGPAMTKIFAGKKADLPGGDFQQFALGLGKLPVNSIDSGKKAYDLLASMLPKGGDAAFILMEKHLHNMAFDPKLSGFFENDAMQAKLEKEGESIWKETFDHAKFPETKRAFDNGFRVNTTEGFYFPTVDLNRLKTAFGSSLSPQTAAWLAQNIREDHEPTASDGGLVISGEELVSRAIFWEKWVAQNPHHPLFEPANWQAYWLVMDVTIGENNTPAFDYESSKPNADFLKNWEAVLKNHPVSALAARVKEMQAAVAADGGKRGPKTEAWVQDYQKLMPD